MEKLESAMNLAAVLTPCHCEKICLSKHHHHHHHKHQGLDHLARSVSRVTAALANVSSVSQPFSFLVDCSGMILKGFGFVAFFAGVKLTFVSYNQRMSTIG
jgi:hypothetical protein